MKHYVEVAVQLVNEMLFTSILFPHVSSQRQSKVQLQSQEGEWLKEQQLKRKLLTSEVQERVKTLKRLQSDKLSLHQDLSLLTKQLQGELNEREQESTLLTKQLQEERDDREQGRFREQDLDTAWLLVEEKERQNRLQDEEERKQLQDLEVTQNELLAVNSDILLFDKQLQDDERRELEEELRKVRLQRSKVQEQLLRGVEERRQRVLDMQRLEHEQDAPPQRKLFTVRKGLQRETNRLPKETLLKMRKNLYEHFYEREQLLPILDRDLYTLFNTTERPVYEFWSLAGPDLVEYAHEMLVEGFSNEEMLNNISKSINSTKLQLVYKVGKAPRNVYVHYMDVFGTTLKQHLARWKRENNHLLFT